MTSPNIYNAQKMNSENEKIVHNIIGRVLLAKIEIKKLGNSLENIELLLLELDGDRK